MKVLIISNLFPPEFIGGYELVAFDIAEKLHKEGAEVKVLTSPSIGSEVVDSSDLDVERILQCVPMSPDRSSNINDVWRGSVIDLHNMKMVARTLLDFQPDRVFCFNLGGIGPIGILAMLHHAKIKANLYLGDNIFGHPFENRDLRARVNTIFDLPTVMSTVNIFPVSEAIRFEVSEELGFQLRGNSVVPGWVNPDNLASGVLPELRDIRSNPGRFVFSSRIAPHKGIDVLIEAVQILKSRGYTDFSVDLFGAGEVAITLLKIKLAGISQYVRFAGCLDKQAMIARFADYDFLLFPTWGREPFGFVAAEAAYMGCPPILTGSCGAAEWFRDSVDCLKIDRNPNALAEAMIFAMAMSDDSKIALKQRCARNARRLFDFSHWFSVLTREADEESHGIVSRLRIGKILTALTVQSSLAF